MSYTVPLFIPFAKGLDLSKEAMLGSNDLLAADNIDYATDDSVQGRPGRSAPKEFVVRDPLSSTGGMLASAAFDATGFTPRGLMRLQDANGERAALACDGRLFTQEDDRWVDRGPFASARVDRVANHASNLTGNTRDAVAPDFGPARVDASGTQWFNLLTSTYAVDHEVRDTGYTGLSGAFSGNGARCGTTTALVAVRPTSNQLKMTYRTNGGTTLTTVTLTSDCATPTEEGDAPSICCSSDSTVFFVAYVTTTANVFKVLKVDITGTVLATYTSAAVPGLAGIWVDNSSVAADRVVVTFTHTGGITLRQLSQSTLADQSLDATHDGSDGAGTVGLDVVVGLQSDTVAWWAYRNSNAVGSGDIVIGTYNLTSGTAARARKYWGGDSYTEASIRWGIAHQPIQVNGRVYLTLIAATDRGTTGTWLALDLTNWFNSTAGTGPFGAPTIVARGPTQATIPHFQPSSAVVLADGSGWVFPTLDWSRFALNAAGSTTGLDASLGLNRVTFIGSKSAQAGQSTVFSGSVPHHVARGQCAELGFPFLAGIPGLSVEAAGGGAVGIGSYSIVVCWRWTDEAGQIHRSAPSEIQTLSIPGGGSNTIRAVVTNPWLTEKVYGSLKIEVYSTDLDPTADAQHFLQEVVSADFSAAYTVVDINTQPVTNTEALYTDGNVFGHYHVPGDGGVAALGRRLWMASGTTIYASKLLLTGYAPSFSDEAPDGLGHLFVTLPAGAGRVVALEALDDKLIIFAERGVWMVQDGGPDNTGIGVDFAAPMRVSDLSIAGPRSSCMTDGGIVFCTTPDSTDPARGGPWLFDRQSIRYIGRPVVDYFATSSTPEVTYNHERQQAFITTDQVNGGSGVVMLDFRVSKWAVWDLREATWGSLRSIAVVGGTLWALSDEPAPFDLEPGTDTGAGDYAMHIQTKHLAANGQDTLGWARVRSVSMLGGRNTEAHTLSVWATLDQTTELTMTPVALSTPAASTTWPSNRHAPEWRLPMQKCSTIQVEASATPATARWAAILLEVAPLPGRAPAKNRV